MALEWTISHLDQLVMATARGDVSPREIEDYFHGIRLEGGMAYAKMFLVDSGSMLSDDNIRTLGGIVERYARTGKIGRWRSWQRRTRLFARFRCSPLPRAPSVPSGFSANSKKLRDGSPASGRASNRPTRRRRGR